MELYGSTWKAEVVRTSNGERDKNERSNGEEDQNWKKRSGKGKLK